MDYWNLLDAVQPTGGFFCVVGIDGKQLKSQELFATKEEVDAEIQRLLAKKLNVFFSVAKFKTADNRKIENVQSLKSFFLDIDCGPDKAELDPKTGRPKGYLTQTLALTALNKFCTTVGLPKPTLVNSGRGVHVYWALDTELTPTQWKPIARSFSKLCIEHKLYVDSVFDESRILRVPGTFNFKDDTPHEVKILHLAPPVALTDAKKILGTVETFTLDGPKRELTALGKAMQGNTENNFRTIMLRSTKGEGCQQLLDCYMNRATLAEPRWFNALSIVKACADRDTAVHMISEGHPDYSPYKAEQKMNGSAGPNSCAEFEKHNPGGCDGCPHKGKITSPIVLGKGIIRATAKDSLVTVESETGVIQHHNIPTYPFPFFRGKNGGIYLKADDKEESGVDKLVYEHDLYITKLMHDPNVGFVAVFIVHLPKDGMKEFVVSNVKITDRGEMRRELSRQGVVASEGRFKYIADYIIASIRELQYKKKAETMRVQFGWADNNSAFIVGDREITKNGIYHSPPSSITEDIAPYFEPRGTLDKWKEVAKLYGRPGLEVQAFAALSAFGAPLLKFTEQQGAIINIIHSKSGAGKTTVLRMINSVFGNPKMLLGTPDDTKVARITKLGILNNLTNTMDEMTNTTAEEFSNFAYAATQGRGKDKGMPHENKLRINKTTWQTITVGSSNSSFFEKLTTLKVDPDGELARLMEFSVDYTDEAIISVEEGKAMFDHQLSENYGQAGDVYMQWVVNNLEEAVQSVLRIQKMLDVTLRLTQRERLWSAVTACNIAGGLIAKQKVGLIDWDIKRIYNHIGPKLLKMRGESANTKELTFRDIIGDYLTRYSQNILAVNDGVDARSNMAQFPVSEPRGELLIRQEPDTRKMFIKVNHFKKDCVDRQISYRDSLSKAQESGSLLDVINKRLTKGSKVEGGSVRCLVFDSTHSDFSEGMEVVEGAKLEREMDDAGGEG